MEYVQIPLFPLDAYEVHVERDTVPPDEPDVQCDPLPTDHELQPLLPGLEEFFEAELDMSLVI